ncbi:L-arabonate dehydratase [Spirochaetota bacterium]|nr:L-arabonate dehydratase [Spirochaetota bacterium]
MKLRSQNWYGKLDKDGFIHRSWMKNQGFPNHVFSGKPVIGICNTWSELTPCNSHLRTLAEAVKRGVWEAGGFPVEFPVTSLGETQIRPTAMLFRNLLAMDTEECIRGYGMDGVVLLGGCDKTTPGQLMGAASVDLPTIIVSAGPMLSGKYKGKDIGSGTDVWRFAEAVRRGTMSLAAFMDAESAMSRSPGVCMTMGTASTMACLVEAMGLALPHNATYPAVDARRTALAHESGNRIVAMVKEDLKLSKIISRQSFENAVILNAAIGGSTNAVIHLLALAGRFNIPFKLTDFDKIGAAIPLLVNCMPAGKYLMEDFCYAGGVPVVLKELSRYLHNDAKTILGPTKPLATYTENAQCFNDDVIRPIKNPLKVSAGIKVITGNLAPDGAVIKTAAATPALLEHTAPAFVFENIEHLKANIDDPKLPVTKDHILVLRGAGPKGYPGMPEVGNFPLPKKILDQGVVDMIRLSDARMSGTAFGTIGLHIAPEAAAGGPLALVETGDLIRLSIKKRELSLLVPEPVLAERRKILARTQRELLTPTSDKTVYSRGYYKLYIDHVMQADKGADFDFLLGSSGATVTRESH